MDILSVKQRFGIIGNSPQLSRALEIAMRVASTDLSVLVTGESGVGKEHFPQVIHAFSPRKHSKYVAVNCGAIPEGTIDSELFGHEKNSFTGANEARKGYFEEANGGTIFLDEVGELPPSTQVRLLRVLQTGEFMRVGSSKPQKTDVRVVAATNVNLQNAIESGRFREDLYYRLNTVPIFVPPLRERKGDISLLFRKFAVDIANQYRMPVITLDEEAKAMLENYYWAGNIRQLKNVAEQISAIEESRLISAEIMSHYLKIGDHSSQLTIKPAASRHNNDMGDEREILYKVLFDLKGDITELKRMMTEILAERKSYESHHQINDIVNYLPQSYSQTPQLPVANNNNVTIFAPTEEITDSDDSVVELTKEQVQRESIVKALRRCGGRRKEAAKELFISERTLYRKIKELGIDEF